jgi:hypothetical protein
VRTSREELGDAGSLKASLGQAKGRSQTSTASTNDYSIILVVNDGIRLGELEGLVAQLERRFEPAPQTLKRTFQPGAQ